jgi:hypothetical protein
MSVSRQPEVLSAGNYGHIKPAEYKINKYYQTRLAFQHINLNPNQTDIWHTVKVHGMSCLELGSQTSISFFV